MSRYMVGMHDDSSLLLDEEATRYSAETLLDDIARYCELRLQNDHAELES